MRIMSNVVGAAILTLLLAPQGALAQAAGAEAKLKELNIVLPPDAAPSANFVNFVQTGNLLFLAGNTPGGDWPLKGKVGKDLTLDQGYQSARQAGMIMLGRSAPRSAASTASTASSRCLAWSTRPKDSATNRGW